MATDWLNHPRAAPYRSLIISSAQSRGVNPSLVANQIGAESGFRPNAVSPTGAQGLAQILRSTARDPGYGVAPISNPFDPNQAIPFAIDYTIARGGYNARGLAAYSGGDYSAGVTRNILTGGDAGNGTSAPMNTNNPTVDTNDGGIDIRGQTEAAPLGVIKIRPKGSQDAGAESDGSGSSGTGSGSRNSSGSGTNSGSAAAGSFTVPQAIDTQTRGNSSNTQSLNKQSESNTKSINETATANTKAATDKAQGLYDATTSGLSDYFVRFIFILVGIIALIGALMLFGKPKQIIQQVAKKL